MRALFCIIIFTIGRSFIWPVIKDMLCMPFCLVLFLDRKPCFFARAFFVKTIRFSEVFFCRKSWGGRGGGKNFGMRSYSEVA